MSEASSRTPLKNGSDWIVLKPEITYGEDLDILDASQVDGHFSLRAHAIARICGWVAAWSFPEPITPESVAARWWLPTWIVWSKMMARQRALTRGKSRRRAAAPINRPDARDGLDVGRPARHAAAHRAGNRALDGGGLAMVAQGERR
jgi:hypothetical protein